MWPDCTRHVTCIPERFTCQAGILVRFALRPLVFKIQDPSISQMYQMTSSWNWTLNSQKYLNTLNNYPEVQIWIHFVLRLAASEIQGPQKLESHWITPNWTWTINSPNTLYVLNTCPWSPNFGPLHSTITFFKMQGRRKSLNTPNDPKLNLNT